MLLFKVFALRCYFHCFISFGIDNIKVFARTQTNIATCLLFILFFCSFVFGAHCILATTTAKFFEIIFACRYERFELPVGGALA